MPKNHSFCAPTPPSGQCLECVREDLEAKLERLKDAYAISQNDLIGANLRADELRDVAGDLLQNVHDLRDHRGSIQFCKVEPCAALAPRLISKRKDEYCTDRSPGFVKGGTLTCSLKAGHLGQHQSTVDGMPCSWR